MQFHAEIIARNEEGVLERVLRVCRHRGFPPQVFRAATLQPENIVHIEIEGESDRSSALLATQLQKLCEVLSVHVGGGEAPFVAASADMRVHTTQVRRAVYASSSHG